MNEPTIIQYAFLGGHLDEVIKMNILTDEWHCKSEPKEIFELVRTEDISLLNSQFPMDRIKLVATDGAAHYISEFIDKGVSLESWTCPIYGTGSMIHLGHQRQRGVDNDPDSVGKSNQTTQRISNRQASEDGFGVFTPQP